MPVKKYLITLCCVAVAGILSVGKVSAQTSISTIHFIDYQRSIPKVGDMLHRKEDTLMKQFREKGLAYPARYISIRSFNYDIEL